MPDESASVYRRSLDLHRAHRGKWATVGKVALKTREDLALAYTPGVAEPVRAIAQNPAEAYNLTNKGNMVAVVTDGSAVLGLGNLGPEAALPVMEGKALIFKQFADIDAVPVCLATQDEAEIIRAVQWLAPSFGAINLEDISAPRCFAIERALQQSLAIPVIHDDQHGTATVVLAGLLNALKLVKKDHGVRIVISGAGAAGTAIARILIIAGFSQIIVCDRSGAIARGRADLSEEKSSLAAVTNPGNLAGDLATVLAGADVFIGVSGPNLLSPTLIKTMAPRPIIFALANPEPEIAPDQALAAGAFIVATGRSDFPNQINNALAFPGIFRGLLDSQAKQFTAIMFVQAARAIADLVGAELSREKILPDIFDSRLVGVVAAAVANHAQA